MPLSGPKAGFPRQWARVRVFVKHRKSIKGFHVSRCWHHPFCPHSRFIRLAFGEPRPSICGWWEGSAVPGETARGGFSRFNPAGHHPRVLMTEGVFRPSPGRRVNHRRISRRGPWARASSDRRLLAGRDGRAQSRCARLMGLVSTRKFFEGGQRSAGDRAHLQALHEARERAGGLAPANGT